jgi:AcrR family transcriptional regulator
MAPDERRRAIIDAVVPLLQQHGAAVTTRQVAEAAGIAEGTIFRVFPDKRALLLATAQETVDPADGEESMAEQLKAIPDLHGKVLATVEHLGDRLERVMVVMMALRAMAAEDPRRTPAGPPAGPPAFMVESNRRLLERLTDLLFAPHAAELRVPPVKAALLLRSLVFGAWHPGMEHRDRLTPEEIADACLHGVTDREVG